jgi:hypothetical protein
MDTTKEDVTSQLQLFFKDTAEVPWQLDASHFYLLLLQMNSVSVDMLPRMILVSPSR